MSTPAESASVRWTEAAALLGYAGRAPIRLVTWLGPAWTGDAARAYQLWAEALDRSSMRVASSLSELASVVARSPSSGWEAERRALERALRELTAVRIPGEPAAPAAVVPTPRSNTPRPRLEEHPGSPRRSGGSVDEWVAEAVRILRSHGYRADQIDAADLKTIIEYESGGDPAAVNHHDGNARRGTPSTGLMQTIPPTFARWHLPGHGNILDPVDNIIAGARYAVARYGSVAQTPGILSLAAGGRYRGY